MAWTSSSGASGSGPAGPPPIGKITIEIYREGPGGASVSVNVPKGSPLVVDGAVDYVHVQRIVAEAMETAATDLRDQ